VIVIAYRTWRVRGGRLYSVGFGLIPWPVGKPHTANCWKNFVPAVSGGHVAPGYDHTCGIYAWLTPENHPTEDPLSFGPHVRGIIRITGKVIVHELGIRVQRALPIAVEENEWADAVARRYRLLVLKDERDW
jgi:hypothetical protein